MKSRRTWAADLSSASVAWVKAAFKAGSILKLNVSALGCWLSRSIGLSCNANCLYNVVRLTSVRTLSLQPHALAAPARRAAFHVAGETFALPHMIDAEFLLTITQDRFSLRVALKALGHP